MEEKMEDKDGMEERDGTEERDGRINQEMLKERVKEREEARKAAKECMSLGPQTNGIGGIRSGRGMNGKEEIGRVPIHLFRVNHGCAVFAC